MDLSQHKYIEIINIKSLRDYILDNNISDMDSIILHQFDFDELAVEYREFYNERLPDPYTITGVLIKEDLDRNVPKGRIQIVKNDPESFNIDNTINESSYPPSHEIIYRCGWCGNVVDFDGTEFPSTVRQYKISLLEKYKDLVPVNSVNGYCCHNRN